MFQYNHMPLSFQLWDTTLLGITKRLDVIFFYHNLTSKNNEKWLVNMSRSASCLTTCETGSQWSGKLYQFSFSAFNLLSQCTRHLSSWDVSRYNSFSRNSWGWIRAGLINKTLTNKEVINCETLPTTCFSSFQYDFEIRTFKQAKMILLRFAKHPGVNGHSASIVKLQQQFASDWSGSKIFNPCQFGSIFLLLGSGQISYLWFGIGKFPLQIPNPCTNPDEILPAHPHLSKEGFGAGLTPAPSPWTWGAWNPKSWRTHF